MLSIAESCYPVNRLYLCDLRRSRDGVWDFSKIVDNFDAQYAYITNEGPVFYFKTNLNSPKYKIVSVDVSSSTLVFRDVVPQGEEPLEMVACTDYDKLVTVYLENVKVCEADLLKHSWLFIVSSMFCESTIFLVNFSILCRSTLVASPGSKVASKTRNCSTCTSRS